MALPRLPGPRQEFPLFFLHRPWFYGPCNDKGMSPVQMVHSKRLWLWKLQCQDMVTNLSWYWCSNLISVHQYDHGCFPLRSFMFKDLVDTVPTTIQILISSQQNFASPFTCLSSYGPMLYFTWLSRSDSQTYCRFWIHGIPTQKCVGLPYQIELGGNWSRVTSVKAWGSPLDGTPGVIETQWHFEKIYSKSIKKPKP